MAVENATYIAGLDDKWPELDADISEGDDHIRLTKFVMKSTFPGEDGNGFKKAITASEDELNRVDGVTSPIQEQFTDMDAAKVGRTGNQTIDGQLEIDHSLVINAPVTGGYTGVNIKDESTDQWGALFNLDIVNKQLNIRQVGINNNGGSQPSLGDPETMLSMIEGQAIMKAFGSTDAVYPKALTTREYVEANFVANTRDQEIVGTLTVQEEVRVIADTIEGVDGYTVYLPDPADNGVLKMVGAFYYAESEGWLGWALITDGVTTASASLRPDGQMFVGDAVVLTTANHAGLAAQANAANGGVSGTFEDNTGKTITVTDGLITDLG